MFARIDHAAGAAEAGLTLALTELMIFGNARGGTPLMQSAQTVGIDLPLKALVWQDASGKTWLSYNEASWIAQRHGVADAQPVVSKMADLLSAISRKAVGVHGVSGRARRPALGIAPQHARIWTFTSPRGYLRKLSRTPSSGT